MSDMQNGSNGTFGSETTARREFLANLGKAAVTAPAVALLVAASAEPAAAQYRTRPIRGPRSIWPPPRP